MTRLTDRRPIAIDMPGHGASDGVGFDGINLRTWFGATVPQFRILARPLVGALMLGMPKPASASRKILAGTVGRTALEAMYGELVRAIYLGVRRHGFGVTVSSYLREMYRGIDATPPRYVLSDTELATLKPPVTVIMGEGEADETSAKRAAAMRRKTPQNPGRQSRMKVVRAGWSNHAPVGTRRTERFPTWV